MNKKNIIIIMVGIFLLSLQFNIHIGSATIDILSDPIAFILIYYAMRDLAPRNIMFKKARFRALLGIIATLLGQGLNLMNWGDGSTTINSIAVGLSVIFTIYFSYYFTEALILEAKFQDKSATTRSFRVIWLILGALIFIHFIAFQSSTNMASILVEALVGICAIFYISSVLTGCKQLYMDGLPTTHMMQ